VVFEEKLRDIRAGVFAVAEITRLVITSRAFMTATYNVELVKTGAERRTKEGGNRKLGLRCSIDVRRRRVRVDPCRQPEQDVAEPPLHVQVMAAPLRPVGGEIRRSFERV
jgi:hypothetical protein